MGVEKRETVGGWGGGGETECMSVCLSVSVWCLSMTWS